MKTQELQLLYIFDAIMTERSVTRAADRLAMTQPAVSNAISRMRQIWNDPLFVRKGRNIEPTSYALSLWDQVNDHMFALTNAVTATQFDPGTSKRKFRLAVTDVTVEMIWRQLIELLEREAPGVDIHAVPYTPEGTHDDLREAHVDLAVGMLNQHDHSLRSTWLFEGGYVLAMREDHPLAGRPITMEEFLEARHLLVTMSGDAHGFVDNYLDQKGHSRRIAATVNHFSIVPQVLRDSNLIAAVPELISQDCGFVNGLWMGELPFGVDPTSLYLIWHARHDRDPGVVWLRAHVEALLQERWHDIMTNSPCGKRLAKPAA
ncbi:LysR family transcriptional regulator [Marinobacter sp. F3R08]|uniref:LysR family transcriptional regulator n=1 Tax=Marinobacter sp. F3R08 TaxID=2841559 RepID=UPI001C09ABEC|nr:LysR family transcriptional regulator [Marinobacter sp. F3R08]MBU2955928.1 LysR family transcriptional regulator [Marinobacter sp. F3R08]